MDGWMIAIIVIVIIILVLLILWVVCPITPSASVINDIKQDARDIPNDRKLQIANLTIAFINLSNQTSNFLQQAICGYKGIGETFTEMNSLAKHIGHNFQTLEGCDELGDLLCQKNELYRELTEDILINKKVIKGNNVLLISLNEKNVEIADIFFTICNKTAKTRYIELLHQYDVLIVSQIGCLANRDHSKYIVVCRESQRIYITIVMTLCYCP